METKNFQQQLVDNFKTVHQTLRDTASNIPWSDLWSDGREAALKVYSYGTRAYTSSSQWVRGVDWAKHWSTAENIASLVSDITVIAYAAAKPIAISSYKAVKAWVKKVDWIDVLEILVVGFLHFIQGVYEAGVRTGRWMHSVNDMLAREFVYLTGALQRPAAAAPTAPVTAATEHQGNTEAQSPNEAVLAEGSGAVDAEIPTNFYSEEFQPSDEDYASNPFTAEIEAECMEKLSETNAVRFSIEAEEEVNTQAPSNFTKVEDSTYSPASHPLYAQLESMTVKQLREVSGIYNKQVKKADLIHAAGLKLAD